MATILNIHGYMTMRECLEDIRRHVEVCAYKALCATASPTNDPNDESWYPAFLDEERAIKADMEAKLQEAAQKKEKPPFVDKPIPLRSPGAGASYNGRKVETDEEGFILHCKDLDIQAFMKVFKYRKSYQNNLMDLFQIREKKAFRKTCDDLINYRNTEFAHIPVENAEKELAGLSPEEEQTLIDNYNRSIALFFQFLRYFPNFSADPEASEDQSYYHMAHNKWCEANKKLHMEEVALETVILQENLPVTEQTLVTICENCGIPLFNLEGKHYLITNDYGKTVKPICAMAQVIAQKDEGLHSKAAVEKTLEKTRTAARNNRKRLGTVIGLCAVVIAILVVLLLVLMGRGGDGNETAPTASTEGKSIVPTQTQPAATHPLIPEYDGPAFISGTGSYAGLTFRISQMKTSGILINYTNEGTTDYTLGWSGGATVEVKTTVGTFTVSTGSGNQKLLHNTTGSFSVDLGQELMGQMQSITVRDIMPLSDSGLPNGNRCTIEIPIQEGDSVSPDATPSAHIRGEGSHGGLKLTIDQKLSGGITVRYDNDGANTYCFGWVHKAKVTVKTTQGNVEATVASNHLQIDKDTTGTFVIEISGQITGTVEEIVISNLNALSANGLPDSSQMDMQVSIPITQTEE